MSDAEVTLQAVLQRAEANERTSRRRAFIFSLIPTVVGLIFLGFTVVQIQAAQHELQSTSQQLSDTRNALATLEPLEQQTKQQLGDSQAALQQANQQRQEAEASRSQAEAKQQEAVVQQRQAEAAAQEANSKAAALQQQIADLDSQLKDRLQKGSITQFIIPPNEVLLSLKASCCNGSGELFNDIIRDQGVIRWNPVGVAPTDGFNSPNYATYVLRRRGLIGDQSSVNDLRVITSPDVGDIAVFNYGYTMFYFLDEGLKPFVIGMTPLDILALDPAGLGEPVEYLAVPR